MTFHGEMNFVSTKKYMISEINACLMLIEIFFFKTGKPLICALTIFSRHFRYFKTFHVNT